MSGGEAGRWDIGGDIPRDYPPIGRAGPANPVTGAQRAKVPQTKGGSLEPSHRRDTGVSRRGVAGGGPGPGG